MITLGFDTSNYTTSAAWFDGKTGENHSRLLDVKPGELGLRQSDALFAHVQRLPALFEALMERCAGTVRAIGVSTRPREAEGSYMPCFVAGTSHAGVLGTALRVPVHAFSHQQGHLAAALWSADRLDLMDRPFLAWHLSGGTTELLWVGPNGRGLTARRIGGTADLSAGQLIDRTGKLLGLVIHILMSIPRWRKGGSNREYASEQYKNDNLPVYEFLARQLRDVSEEYGIPIPEKEALALMRYFI